VNKGARKLTGRDRGVGQTRYGRGSSHRRALVAAVAAPVLLLAACTGADEPGGEPGTAERGGTAVIAMVQEAGGMNQLFHDQSGAFIGGEAAWVVEPLFIARPDGAYEPVLASEVPTVENGGVSEDGLTVTYRLRDGITWSDGEPLTAEDLVYTWDVFQDPGSTALVPTVYEAVESVTEVDELTVEVTLREPTPTYLELFRQTLPAHMFDSTTVTAEHEQATLPLGTGPFVFDEFKAGDEVTLTRNEGYWRDPELPYLDGITLKIVPELEVATSAFLEGQYDSVFFFTTGDLADLEAAQEAGAPIEVETQETDSWVEWLFLNHSTNGDPDAPHPVLGTRPSARRSTPASTGRRSSTRCWVVSGPSSVRPSTPAPTTSTSRPRSSTRTTQARSWTRLVGSPALTVSGSRTGCGRAWSSRRSPVTTPESSTSR